MLDDGSGDGGNVLLCFAFCMTLIDIALVCLPILPTDLEDLVGRQIVVLLQDLEMAAVDGPAVGSIEWRGQNYCLIDKTLLFGLGLGAFCLDVSVFKGPLPQPVKGCSSRVVGFGFWSFYMFMSSPRRPYALAKAFKMSLRFASV